MLTIQEIVQQHDFGRKMAEALGLSDGKSNIPHYESTFSDSEGVILGHYEGILTQLSTERGQLEGYRIEYQNLLFELNRIEKDPLILDLERDTLQKQLSTDIKLLEDEQRAKIQAAENHPDYTGKRGNYTTKKSDLSLLQSRLGRDHLNMLNLGIWYFITLAALGLAELPINSQVFNVFGANRIETYIMAFTLVIGVPVLSHLSGIYLKRRREKRENIVLFFIVFVIVCILFGVISYIRSEYIKTVVEEIDLQNSNNSGIPNIVFFFLISLLIYVVGTWLSYSNHDESKQFEEAHKAFNNAKIEFDDAENALENTKSKIKNEYNSRKQGINDSYFTKLNEIQNRPTAIRAQIRKVEQNFATLRKEILGKQQNINSNFKMAIRVYRNTNKTNRGDKQHPICFDADKIVDLSIEEIDQLNK